MKDFFKELSQEIGKVLKEIWNNPFGRLAIVSLILRIAVSILLGSIIIVIGEILGVHIQIRSPYLPYLYWGVWFILEIFLLRAFAKKGHQGAAKLLEVVCLVGAIVCLIIVPFNVTFFPEMVGKNTLATITYPSTSEYKPAEAQYQSLSPTPACDGTEHTLYLQPHHMTGVINPGGHCNLHVDTDVPFCFVDLHGKSTCVGDPSTPGQIKEKYFQRILAENTSVVGGYSLLPPSP